ncbi:unnamed protein product [Ectocarpus sp. CCAP 1310/34]|nr:unnamed protein product [Ectocarpus sp. CCAP 1310/34]
MCWLSNALLLLALAPVVSAELVDDFNIPKGWRMQDRYHGFRYEATVDQGCLFDAYAEAAQAAADELACFGWVQRTSPSTMAGESRCSKATGEKMQGRLRQGPPGNGCDVVGFETKDYADTKIKLHFSHFKILDEERKTCFRDTPHQCPEFSAKKNPEADDAGFVAGLESCSEGGCAATADTVSAGRLERR